MKKVFTSESITEGHPDKVCDRIADSVLDAILAVDPDARVACECAATSQYLLVMGEITTTAEINVEKIARDKIRQIGYTDDKLGFSACCSVMPAAKPRNSCRLPSCFPISSANGWKRSERAARCRICGPTEKARSAWNT